jgi:GGDEF domain-containing protein
VERALGAWDEERAGDAAAASVEASFGIALSLGGAVEHLLRRADEAMYEAKRSHTRLEVAA